MWLTKQFDLLQWHQNFVCTPRILLRHMRDILLWFTALQMETQNQLSNGIGTATSVVLIEAGDWKQRMLCSVVLLSCCSLDSRRAREISHAVDENCSTTTGWNSELSTL